MAIKKTIEIDVDIVGANGGLENVVQNFKKSEEAAKSLKAQLREAQSEVAKLSEKFGATSKEAVQAAKRASELKDRIGDAKSLTDAFNPDAKFNALSKSLTGVASGFAAYQGALGLVGVESKDLEKQLLKVQSALAIAQGLQGLGEARDSFKQLKAVAIDAFKGIKTAIGSTGIGLLVVALGTIYAYWDDIKEVVSGVSEEQKKLNQASQKNLETQEKKLKAIGDQDEVLKLQGKSERQILEYKKQQTNEAISASQINLKNIEITNKEQEKAVKQNYEYLKSFIDFISIPQRYLFESAAKTINKVIDLINKIPGVNIKAKVDEKFGDEAADYLTKLVFDPEEVKKKGESTLEEAQNSLNSLINQRAGYQNQINNIDKNALEKEKELLDEKYNLEQAYLKKQNDAELAALDLADVIRKENEDRFKTEQQKKLDDEALAYEARKKQIENDLVDEATKKAALEQLEINHKDKINGINKEAADKLLADKIEAAEKERQIDDAITQAKFDAAQTALDILMQFAGKNKSIALAILALQKGLAIGEVIVNASKSLAVGAANLAAIPAVLPPGVPNPAYPLAVATTAKSAILTKITAATSIAAILASGISEAQSLKGGGGGSAGGGGAGGGGGAPAAAPQFNIVGQSSTNQLSQTIAGQQNRPIQTYVVGNQVSTQQALDRNAVATSTFG